MTTISDLEQRALVFATDAHASIGQLRKYTNDPYIVHPIAVAELVRSVPHTEAMVAAALLHDVCEDVKVHIDIIEKLFGTEVSTLVWYLTDISKPTDGNRVARKAIDRRHISLACPAAKTIKIADLSDNTRSIVAHDPDFARTYLPEKSALLEVLKDGDATLWAMADEQVNRAMMQLGFARK